MRTARPLIEPHAAPSQFEFETPGLGVLRWNVKFHVEGESHGRFSVPESIPDPGRTDCYLSRLRISDVISTDSRVYYLNVANERGQTRQGIELHVRLTVAKKIIT